MNTIGILDAIIDRLKVKLPHLAAEYFPDKPALYRLNHPKGALLVSYAGGQYEKSVATDRVIQPRRPVITVTVVMRELNGRNGAVQALDDARQALVGFRPPDCKPCWVGNDKFLGENAGLWQYALDISTETMLVEIDESEDGPLLVDTKFEDES